jgi:ankyrin repeat protein
MPINFRSLKRRQGAFLLLVSLLSISGTARADKTVCDDFGSTILCAIVLVPVVAVGTVVMALAPDKPHESAAKAISSGNLQRLDEVLKAHPEIATEGFGYQLLNQAVRMGRRDLVDTLLTAGIRAYPQALEYSTRVEITQLLLEKGASADEVKVNQLVIPNRNPEFYEMLTLILDRRKNVDSNAMDMRLLLTDAASRKDEKLLNFLLVRGVNPQGNPNDPAMIALLRSHALCPGNTCTASVKTMLKALIERQADVNVLQKSGCQTPLFWAQKSGDPELISMLKIAGAATSNEECLVNIPPVRDR